MNLSDELFQQVEASLCAAGTKTLPDNALPMPPGEQRSARRVVPEAGTLVRLIPLTDSVASGPIDVSLRNFAPGGAGFQFSTKIALSDQFVLMLPTPEGHVAVLCGVAYWQPIDKDLFAIGARFNRVLCQTEPARPPSSAPAPLRRAV